MSASELLVERRHAVTLLTLNRPEVHNAAARDGELRAGVRGFLERRRAPREAGEGGATGVLHP